MKMKHQWSTLLSRDQKADDVKKAMAKAIGAPLESIAFEEQLIDGKRWLVASLELADK